MNTPIFAKVHGTKIDLATATFSTRKSFSTDRAARAGRADIIQGEISVTAYREDGSTYPFMFWVGQVKLGKKTSNNEAATTVFLRAQGEASVSAARMGADKFVTLL